MRFDFESAGCQSGAVPMGTILDICRGLPECRFAAGEIVMTEGEKAGPLYFLFLARWRS